MHVWFLQLVGGSVSVSERICSLKSDVERARARCRGAGSGTEARASWSTMESERCRSAFPTSSSAAGLRERRRNRGRRLRCTPRRTPVQPSLRGWRWAQGEPPGHFQGAPRARQLLRRAKGISLTCGCLLRTHCLSKTGLSLMREYIKG